MSSGNISGSDIVMSSLEFFLKILRSDSRADTAIRIPTDS